MLLVQVRGWPFSTKRRKVLHQMRRLDKLDEDSEGVEKQVYRREAIKTIDMRFAVGEGVFLLDRL